MEFKMDKFTNTGMLALCLALVAGCTSTPEPNKVEPEKKPNNTRSLNQPEMAKLEPVNSDSHTVSNTKLSSRAPLPTSGSLIAGGSKSAKSTATADMPASAAAKPSATKTATITNVPSATKNDSIASDIKARANTSFFIYESETYKSALSRWLNAEGYKKIGTLLDDNQERLLNNKVSASQVIQGDFDTAFSTLIKEAKKESFEDRNGKKLSQEERGALYIDVRLDKPKQEAIVTSSKLPTTMFIVEKGSLLENYLKLGKAYGWDVREEFFLGENWTVEFSYPIVTEKGNIKSALEQLLSRYEALRGALVPSVRQAFVLTNSGKK